MGSTGGGGVDAADGGDNSSQQYNFRWHDYPQSVVSTFKNLKEEEDFVDVTLACNSQQFTAHKVVLSACSPYFRKLLKSNPCQHPIVILRDVTEQDLQSLLKFMYNGEVQISEGRLKEFLRTAETLQVRGLTDGAAAATAMTASAAAAAAAATAASATARSGSAAANSAKEEPGQRPTSSPAPRSMSAATMEPESQLDNGGGGGGRSLDSPLFGPSSAKRHRQNGPESESPSPNNNNDSVVRWGLGGGGGGGHHRSRSSEMDHNGSFSRGLGKSPGESLLSQALEKHSGLLRSNLGSVGGGGGGVGIDMSSNSCDGRGDDSASDTASDRQDSLIDDGHVKSESDLLHRHSPAASSSNPLFPPGLEALYRQAGFPSAFLGLAAGAAAGGNSGGGSRDGDYSGMTSSVPQVGLQSHAGNPNLAGKLDMMRVRATDPRPCPKCGKIYRSAHTLRTHMEDKHTICPGYRCVLCGTVAKSRNSLHSHMSRQHRGISTKDLPVVPMPAPFDAGLASRLLAKAGVKVSPNELAARASPTAPRRSDLPKLDSNLLVMQHQQFPLPASVPSNMMQHHRDGGGDMDDHRRTPTSASPFGGGGQHSPRGLNPKDFAAYLGGHGAAQGGGGGGGGHGGMGSALLDTYLSMIAAAGGDTNAMAAALNFQNSASRAAAFAAAAAAAAAGNDMMSSRLLLQHPTNGDKDSSDNEDMAGELGSDAENEDDLSDNEEEEGRGEGMGLGGGGGGGGGRREEEEEEEMEDHEEKDEAHGRMTPPPLPPQQQQHSIAAPGVGGEEAATTAAN